jgi:hypothetical protein
VQDGFQYIEIADKVVLKEVKDLKKTVEMLSFPSLRSGQAFPGLPGQGSLPRLGQAGGGMTLFFSDLILAIPH